MSIKLFRAKNIFLGKKTSAVNALVFLHKFTDNYYWGKTISVWIIKLSKPYGNK